MNLFVREHVHLPIGLTVLDISASIIFILHVYMFVYREAFQPIVSIIVNIILITGIHLLKP